MQALLDVNVLIACLDADHTLHARAAAWFAPECHKGWASCPITENGCVRIMAHPGYPNPLPVHAVGSAPWPRPASHPLHEFWPDELSLLDGRVVDTARVHGPRQLRDVYLLALAVRRGGRFVTFDASSGSRPFPAHSPGTCWCCRRRRSGPPRCSGGHGVQRIQAASGGGLVLRQTRRLRPDALDQPTSATSAGSALRERGQRKRSESRSAPGPQAHPRPRPRPPVPRPRGSATRPRRRRPASGSPPRVRLDDGGGGETALREEVRREGRGAC